VTTFRARIAMAAPPQAVWDTATDWVAQRDWIPGTRVYLVEGDGASAGSRLVAFTGVADVGFLDEFRIVEWQPPRRCRVEHTGRVVRGDGIFEVRPEGDLTVFEWIERLQAPLGLVGRFGLTLVRPLFEAGMRWACRRFAARCMAAVG
jgi:carbon monoxide dehydrogenase subunit G